MKDKPATTSPRKFYSTGEFAVFIGWHPESVRRAIKAGRIKATKFGNGWRVADAEFDRISVEGIPASKTA